MPTEENKTLIRRLVDELWNKGNPAIIDEFFARTWVNHSAAASPGLAPGREGLRQLAAAISAAFSDAQTSLDDQVAEGDMVAWRWSFRGTHTGEFMGIPPTGQRVTLTGISLDRIGGDQFLERWESSDALGLLQQLGVVPAPA